MGQCGGIYAIEAWFQPNDSDAVYAVGGQEKDLLAYPLLKGSDEFGTRARYSTTSTRGRHRTGIHVRPDRPGLHHGLRGLGVYQFCPQRSSFLAPLSAWRSLLLLESAGHLATSHRFRLAARDSQRRAAQRSGGRGVRASGLSSTPGKPTTRCVDLRYRRFISSAGRSPFSRKSLAEYSFTSPIPQWTSPIRPC